MNHACDCTSLSGCVLCTPYEARPTSKPVPTTMRVVITIDMDAVDFPLVTERVRSALLQHFAQNDGQTGEFRYPFDQTYDYGKRRHSEMIRVKVDGVDYL